MSGAVERLGVDFMTKLLKGEQLRVLQAQQGLNVTSTYTEVSTFTAQQLNPTLPVNVEYILGESQQAVHGLFTR